jgi:hypothetical protein
MAKYSYNELKVAATEGRRIGAYLGKNVFACSKWKYDPLKGKDNFYVLYDEDNKLVCDGIVYGTISDKGLVDEWNNKRTWISPQSQVAVKFEPVAPKVKSQTSQPKTVPASAYSALVNGGEGVVSSENFFANLDREINELLATPFEAGDMPWVKNEV